MALDRACVAYEQPTESTHCLNLGTGREEEQRAAKGDMEKNCRRREAEFWMQGLYQELVRVKGPQSKCPTCRVYFDGQSVKSNIALDQITRALPVKCCNRDGGWEGMYGNVAAHYARCHMHKCEEKAVKYTMIGCSRIVKHRDIKEHITEAAASCHRLQSRQITMVAKV